jgi:hypothetical protein
LTKDEGSHSKIIGYFDTNFGKLSESDGQTFDLINVRGNQRGSFVVEKLNLERVFSFSDYLRSGIQLNLITAIDFTASNKQPTDPKSLHYLENQGINQYSNCIRSVGEILCPYDSDQLFPVFGFGAKVGGHVSHCFPLIFNSETPCVHRLDGIMQVYYHALQQVQLSGPTLFASIIQQASNMAHQHYIADQTYTMLLIITDGIINGRQDRVDAIVDAGKIPLSIFIV